MYKLEELFDSADLDKATDYYISLERFDEGAWRTQRTQQLLDLLRMLYAQTANVHAAFILYTIDRIGDLRNNFGDPTKNSGRYTNLCHAKEYPRISTEATKKLLSRKLPFAEPHYLFALNRIADLEMISIWTIPFLPHVVKLAEKYLENTPITKEFDRSLERLFKALEWIGNAPEKKTERPDCSPKAQSKRRFLEFKQPGLPQGLF